MAETPEKLQEFLEMLSFMEDRAERIEMLISTADQFKSVPAEIASPPYAEAHRVPGCESEAFSFSAERDDGTLDFYFAVQNPQGISAMCMAVILTDACSGAPLDQVLAVNEDVIYEVFGRELSMGKSMGLMGMVGIMKNQARMAAAQASVVSSIPNKKEAEAS